MVKQNPQIKRIITDYKKGVSIRGLAKKYSMTRNQIKKELVKNEIDILKSKSNTITMSQLKLELQESSITDISKKYNVSRMTIYRLIQKYELENQEQRSEPDAS